MLFGRKDFSPSVNQQILISSELLLFFLEASCHGHKPALETLLLNGILWHDKFIVVEACLPPKTRQASTMMNSSCLRIPSNKSVLNAGLWPWQTASRKSSNSLELIKIC